MTAVPPLPEAQAKPPSPYVQRAMAAEPLYVLTLPLHFTFGQETPLSVRLALVWARGGLYGSAADDTQRLYLIATPPEEAQDLHALACEDYPDARLTAVVFTTRNDPNALPPLAKLGLYVCPVWF